MEYAQTIFNDLAKRYDFFNQIASLFPAQVFGNMGTFIVFRLVDEASLRRVGDTIGLNDTQRDAIRNLEMRRCVVFSHLC